MTSYRNAETLQREECVTTRHLSTALSKSEKSAPSLAEYVMSEYIHFHSQLYSLTTPTKANQTNSEQIDQYRLSVKTINIVTNLLLR